MRTLREGIEGARKQIELINAKEVADKKKTDDRRKLNVKPMSLRKDERKQLKKQSVEQRKKPKQYLKRLRQHKRHEMNS
jgi:hypothetical protein